MRWGFKSGAEKASLRFRQEMKVSDISPLSMRALARHLEVKVFTPCDIPGLAPNEIAAILHKESGWSAFYLVTPFGDLIVHNSSSDAERQESDIAHELSHAVCRHEPDEIVPFGDTGILARTFNREQEEEAAYQGGCLQLPQKALVHCLFRDMTYDDIASAYHASPEMVRYRVKISGAENIVRSTRSRQSNTRYSVRRPSRPERVKL